MASPNAKPTWATLHTDPALKDRQDKLVKAVHSQMMDFKMYSPDKLETCVKKLIQLFDNILQSPDEDKYRKARVLFAAMQQLLQTAAVNQHAGQGKQCNLQAGCSRQCKAK